MHRRDFLKISALGLAQLGFWSACATREHQLAATPFRLRPFPWEEATIPELQAAMESGDASAVSLAKQYLRRIEEVDGSGPMLRSVLEINPDALAIAHALDRERRAHGPRGPMHGIPVLIKDNIATHDRMMTTAGSLALLGSVPPRDAFLVNKLRQAGAVILGKANLSEWANFRGRNSSSGWSARGGQTKNPYVLDRNPSGSSSGSAAAVSANLCAVAVGTETDGSIMSPSAVCGVVGLKPTVGLISRAGIIPISHTQDTAGPIARTVTDAAILLGALTGEDPRDPATRESRGRAHEDYTRFLSTDGLRGARLGVARQYFRGGERRLEVLENALERLREAGAVLVDPVEMSSLRNLGDAEWIVLQYEFKAGLNAYLAELGPGAPVRSLEEIIEFNLKNADRELPYFGQETLASSQAKGPLTDEDYLEALEKCRRLTREEGIDAVMEEHRLDAIVAPAAGPAGTTDWVYGNRGVGGSSSPAAVAGYPNITVPAGDVLGLPVGISFFGRAYSEPTLLKLAYAFEQIAQARRPPEFYPTLP